MEIAREEICVSELWDRKKVLKSNFDCFSIIKLFSGNTDTCLLTLKRNHTLTLALTHQYEF